jgi:hypothetical protein
LELKVIQIRRIRESKGASGSSAQARRGFPSLACSIFLKNHFVESLYQRPKVFAGIDKTDIKIYYEIYQYIADNGFHSFGSVNFDAE